jgi:hypothetical protein
LIGCGRIGHRLQVPAARADRDSNCWCDAGSERMAIDPQSAMTPLYFQARPERPRPGLVPAVAPRRLRAIAQVAGLVILTTVAVTLVITVTIGAALFTILNIS